MDLTQATRKIMYEKYDLSYCETEHDGLEDKFDVRTRDGLYSLASSDFIECVPQAPSTRVRALYSTLMLSFGHVSDMDRRAPVVVPDAPDVKLFMEDYCPLFTAKTDNMLSYWDLVFLKEFIENSLTDVEPDTTKIQVMQKEGVSIGGAG